MAHSDPRLPETSATEGSAPVASWWMVGVLFVAALVSYTDRLILSVLVDPLRGELGLTDTAVSVLQGTAFTLVYVCAAIPLGRLADRTDRRLMLICGSTLWCGATVLCGLASSFAVLAVGRVLIGIGEAVLVPAAVSMIADAFPTERRGTAIGAFATGTVIGGPLGISIGGALLQHAQHGGFADWPAVGGLTPWRLVLVLVGIAGFVVPLLLATVREPRRAATLAESEGRSAIADLVPLWRRLLPIYVGLALLSIGDYGLLSWAPTTLGRTFGWDPGRIGLTFGVITTVAALVGAALGGWCSDRAESLGGPAGRLLVCALGAVVAALAAALMAIPDERAVLVSIGGWVLASTFGAIGGIAVIQAAVPAHLRATGAALLTFSNTLIGLGVGPSLIALATDYVYGSPGAVGIATATTIAPGAALGMAMLLIARRAAARDRLVKVPR